MHPAVYRSYQFFVAVKAGLPAWAGGLPGQLPPADAALMQSILRTPAQQALFNRMPPNDRRHAIAVVKTLQQASHTEAALLQAALLHDVAKSIGQPILHRVAIVLLEAFWPSALRKLGQWPEKNYELRTLAPPGTARQGKCARSAGVTNDELSKGSGDPSVHQFADSPIRQFPWWRRPFVVHAHHPAIGAVWAATANCQPVAVQLVAKHQDKLADPPATTEEKLLAALQWADNLN